MVCECRTLFDAATEETKNKLSRLEDELTTEEEYTTHRYNKLTGAKFVDEDEDRW